jgi:serine protease Do
MKRILVKFAALAMFAFLANPLLAQDAKEKEKDKRKDVEQIIITKKGDDKEKVVVEISGDKITVNGKPIEDLKEGDLKVYRNKFKSFDGLSAMTIPRAGTGNWDFNWNDNNGMSGMSLFGNLDENRAMLGVTTEKVEQGAKVNEVTDESAAEKAGIKEGDIITKIGDTKIEDPDALSEAVRKHKPGEKVSVTFLRDKKEQKVTAELGKWKGLGAFSYSPKMPDMKIFEQALPRYKSSITPRVFGEGQNLAWAYGGAPRLGLSVQDTDDGKGVKVIEVDEESNAAKAGVKENDIITNINDKEVNSADEVAKMVRENKDKVSLQLKIKRDGKAQTIEVKMPRKLKTADL